MTRIAFIGLGNMGGGMAARLVGAGHEVTAFALSPESLDLALIPMWPCRPIKECRTMGFAARL